MYIIIKSGLRDLTNLVAIFSPIQIITMIKMVMRMVMITLKMAMIMTMLIY